MACHLQAFRGLPGSFFQISDCCPGDHLASLDTVKVQNIEGQLSWWPLHPLGADLISAMCFWILSVGYGLSSPV